MPLPIQRRLILYCTVTFAVLLTLVGVVSYRFLGQQLDVDASDDLDELTTGLHGYLQFEDGQPLLVFDDRDDNQAAFVHKAARYYQIYDASDGGLLTQSDGMAFLGLHLTLDDVRRLLDRPETDDVQTAYGRFRFSTSIVMAPSGERYLLRVGASLDPTDAARRRYLELLLSLAFPTVLATLGVVWWMSGRALTPLNTLATEA